LCVYADCAFVFFSGIRIYLEIKIRQKTDDSKFVSIIYFLCFQMKKRFLSYSLEISMSMQIEFPASMQHRKVCRPVARPNKIALSAAISTKDENFPLELKFS
jgi:hypothetical protein